MTDDSQLFKEDPNAPGGWLASPAGLFLIASDAAYDPESGCTHEGHLRGLLVVQRLLSAASKAGFAKGQLLETMLFSGEVSQRVKDLAFEMTETLGQKEAAHVIQRAMEEDIQY